MLMPWSRSWWPKVGVAVPSRARRESVETAAEEESPAAGGEGGDPLFEGGGHILLPPIFWEKAGWGVAVLAALVASGTVSAGETGPRCPGRAPAIVGSDGGFPRTSQSPRISLHVYGR